MDTAQNIDLSPAQRARGVEALYATGHWLLIEERFKDAADLFRAMCMIAESDERAWLGLGAAHEGALHDEVAIEMYATGFTLTKAGRLAVATARVLRRLGRDDDAERALEDAAAVANETSDLELIGILAHEGGQS